MNPHESNGKVPEVEEDVDAREKKNRKSRHKYLYAENIT